MPPLRAVSGRMWLLAFVALAAPARADWREDFEGPDISWHEAGGDVRYTFPEHRRASEGAHSGRGCEQLRVVGTNGSAVYLRHDIPAAPIIAELTPSVWVKSDRAGLQLLVRAVLPRSQDPRQGGPLTTLLAGPGYTQAGNWQQLRLEKLPQLLEHQVWVLRKQYGPSVDAREAYIDQVVLNVYGGPGTTNVWIDDLELNGAVRGAERSPSVSADAVQESAESGVFTRALSQSSRPGGPTGADIEVALRGSMLMVGDKPFFPRIIEHRGEPLARLQTLGFNTVRLAREPTPDQLAEAARAGMWLLAPPPAWLGDGAAARSTPLGAEYAPVLAWDLGSGMGQRELETVRRWSKALRAADPRKRPILCGPESGLYEYSRQIDVLWQARPVLGTSLELSAYARWLRDRQLLARPGTPVWTAVQTQPLAALQEQTNLLAGRTVAVDRLQDEQIRQMVFAALAAGVRGLCFESQTPLDAADAATRRRAELLELINLELDLIEPWSAAGNFVTTAASNDPQGQAAVVQTERGRLLLPLRTTPQSQFALGLATAPVTTYVVPGVPETNEAYELCGAGMRPIPHQRVAGGLNVTLSGGQAGSLVVLTQDVLVVNYLTRRTSQVADRALKLERDLAQQQMQFVTALNQRLTNLGRGLPSLQPIITSAQTALGEAEAANSPAALMTGYMAARRAVENLHQVERAHWEKGAGLTPNWLASPPATNVATLPEQWLLAVELAGRKAGPNQLAGGEFENLPRMLQVGWRHTEQKIPGIESEAALLATAPHGGKMSLRLKSKPAPKATTPPPVLLELPPIAVTTPAVPVRAGQIVWIHGWVRMGGPPGATVDGLVIVDSLGGEALAERVYVTKGWRNAELIKQGRKPLPPPKDPPASKSKDKLKDGPNDASKLATDPAVEDWKEFALYRAAPQNASVTVTFALTGLGEAWLDDVTIQLIDRGAGPLNQANAAPPIRGANAAR